MNILQFNFKQIKSRPLSSILNIILFSTGVSIISMVFLVRDSFENQMSKNAGGVDLVVGAKGSPLQLILSSIYHVDYPTGNINFNEAMALGNNVLVEKAVPLALGDNFNGFRIVGTNNSYLDFYGGQLREGDLWTRNFEVTIGSKVAEKSELIIGSQFSGVHGLLAESGHVHENMSYKVVGILKETGTVLDQLILTNVESVWEIHEHEHEHEHEEADRAAGLKEITSLLVSYKNPMGAITLPRFINKSTNMQAASPVQEINRLYSLLGVGIEALTYISGFIILISGLSIFISLLISLKERKYELALIRVMGGGRFRLFAIVIMEGVSLAIIGYIVAFVLSRLAVVMLSAYAADNFNYSLLQWMTSTDLYLLVVSIVIGVVSAIIPGIKAMNTNISKTLSQ